MTTVQDMLGEAWWFDNRNRPALSELDITRHHNGITNATAVDRPHVDGSSPIEKTA